MCSACGAIRRTAGFQIHAASILSISFSPGPALLAGQFTDASLEQLQNAATGAELVEDGGAAACG
jgi:hypothetical protein